MVVTRNGINDLFLSLLCGLALLGAARAVFGLLVGYVPDGMLLQGDNPMLRLSLARLLLFGLVVALLALPFAWPLGRHAASRELATTLPGAACAAVLYVMLERIQLFAPFPLWLDIARALLLFVALPLAARFWWRRGGA